MPRLVRPVTPAGGFLADRLRRTIRGAARPALDVGAAVDLLRTPLGQLLAVDLLPRREAEDPARLVLDLLRSLVEFGR